ncbi:VOC family protein [Streptomyces sp. NBC_00536]|uniref:VOC family protein n=1 Tax=Streptomyces sp. NBC_00536 TaxID=2975769 RepID=UPI002E821E82|nr:VOC family protein [Streptomyces sp. NBC_00536]WUC83030.1 VOC family protein [Streptomyces sp. NBC_00536]
MNITRHPENSVSWIDLGTPDTETTAAFYTALFGWTVAPPDPNGYRLCTLRGQLVAALGPAEDPGAPYWTINVTVSDIQATATRFTSLGARIIVAPNQVGTLGHAAVALDPVGAPLSLWQPGTHTGMQLAHEPGTFAGISLLTGHPEQAAAFYRRALHWSSNPEHTEFRLPDNSTAATSPPPDEPTAQRSLWLVRFASNQPDADAERARQLGATEVRQDSNGDVVLRDPTGALFGLTQHTR